jgi:hypothetical protein
MAIRINIFSKLRSLWKTVRRRHSLGAVRRVKSMQEIPEILGRAVYIVGTQEPKWMIISCPCRCGERIDINLMRSRVPNWQLRFENGVVSLRPSLWLPNDKCGSHFWIVKGRVIWVAEKVSI